MKTVADHAEGMAIAGTPCAIDADVHRSLQRIDPALRSTFERMVTLTLAASTLAQERRIIDDISAVRAGNPFAH
ncbi:hypothetical protein A5662_11960 [Mycobacteriaceae bacterium 1482268.1]|nr:hypothetical protein A5662_11960 [Mycobacteriaceae bacterium 1482268.1]